MQTKEQIMSRIIAHLPVGPDCDGDIREETHLADLGVNSMHLITLVLALNRESKLDFKQISSKGMPITIGDLVRLLEGTDSIA